MNTRQKQAFMAAGLAKVAMSRFTTLGELERWHQVRKMEINQTITEIRSILDLLDLVSPVAAARPKRQIQSAIVYVPVSALLHTSQTACQLFETKGLLGGITSCGVQRDNDERWIPKKARISQYNPATGLVGVDRKWLDKKENADLRAYVASFAASITKL